jgi:hypothetical protein
MTGEVALQGRNNWSNVTVAVGDREVQTEADGRFSIGLTGDDSLSMTAPGYLSAATDADLSEQPDGMQIDLGQIELPAGDMNQDGQINILDLAYIAGRYDSSDSVADLNQDGVVNIFDLSLAAGNYDRQGPVNISLSGDQP